MKINDHLFAARLRSSGIRREGSPDEFHSDKSRIVFCSSFRRMMQKAQVFSLEANTSVRNRLTHSLEVADIGRTLARRIGKELQNRGFATSEDVESMQSIVENACLIHDIGNPAFGHFGEEAIKRWFRDHAHEYMERSLGAINDEDRDESIYDFLNFDGNPQGFRIVTRLHSELDQYGLNLSYSTLLASIKYPNFGKIETGALFPKKLGVFGSEKDIYTKICRECSIEAGHRYWLAYIMELADDICYCLSDIADSFEKNITTSRDFNDEFRAICKAQEVDIEDLIPNAPITNFSYQVSIKIARKIVDEAALQFASNIEDYLDGKAKEMSEILPSGGILKCIKSFARRFIYTNREAQQIEIAGSRIVTGLLEHFGLLLKLRATEFSNFVEGSGSLVRGEFEIEWRIFNQLSKRMLAVYKHLVADRPEPIIEWQCRARLIVDFISGMTDNSALRAYQNFMGISL